MAAAHIAASIAATTRRKLKRAKALSENAAKKPEEIALGEKWLQILGVKKTNDSRYYIESKEGKHC